MRREATSLGELQTTIWLCATVDMTAYFNNLCQRVLKQASSRYVVPHIPMANALRARWQTEGYFQNMLQVQRCCISFIRAQMLMRHGFMTNVVSAAKPDACQPMPALNRWWQCSTLGFKSNVFKICLYYTIIFRVFLNKPVLNSLNQFQTFNCLFRAKITKTGSKSPGSFLKANGVQLNQDHRTRNHPTGWEMFSIRTQHRDFSAQRVFQKTSPRRVLKQPKRAKYFTSTNATIWAAIAQM